MFDGLGWMGRMHEKFANVRRRGRVVAAGVIASTFALCACAVNDNGRTPPGFGVAASGAPAVIAGSAGTSGAPAQVGAAGSAGVPSTPGVAGMSATSMNPAAGSSGRGASGVSGSAGASGNASAQSGRGGSGISGHGGASGMQSIAGAGGAGGMSANGETGLLIGMTAAHNAVRAMVQTNPPLQPLTWSTDLAAYAQDWANQQAMGPCNLAMHRSNPSLNGKPLGENLAVGSIATAQEAVDGWAGEVACWTYGTINDPPFAMGTEKCDASCYMAMHSDGCGHYTQIVWRATTQVGCGVAACSSGGFGTSYVWICNYSPAGNFAGEAPY